MLINGVKDFDSHAMANISSPTFNSMYYSPIISNASKLTIEVYDHEYGLQDDELMSSWDYFPVYRITLTNRIEGKLWSDGRQNKVFFEATWTPVDINLHTLD